MIAEKVKATVFGNIAHVIKDFPIRAFLLFIVIRKCLVKLLMVDFFNIPEEIVRSGQLHDFAGIIMAGLITR